MLWIYGYYDLFPFFQCADRAIFGCQIQTSRDGPRADLSGYIGAFAFKIILGTLH